MKRERTEIQKLAYIFNFTRPRHNIASAGDKGPKIESGLFWEFMIVSENELCGNAPSPQSSACQNTGGVSQEARSLSLSQA